MVFLDSSGQLNLCADVTAATYHQVPTALLLASPSYSLLQTPESPAFLYSELRVSLLLSLSPWVHEETVVAVFWLSLFAWPPQVQHEAQLSMALLDSKVDDGLQMLLMTPKPMIRAFDHVLQ